MLPLKLALLQSQLARQQLQGCSALLLLQELQLLACL
jgi:hypothetical protein